MANQDDLMLPTLSFTQSASHDYMNPSGRNADEICENRTRKEFEYNQFFILAETRSLPAENSSEIALVFSEQVASPNLALQVEHNNAKLTYPAHILGEAEDCEVFDGILESGDFVIVPTRRDLESCSGMNDGSDVSRAFNDELDADSGIDKQLSDEVDEGIDKATSTRATISEAQSFLNDIKQNSETRFKILDEVSPASSVDIKADTEHLKTELELIEKLDMKLQQLENVEPSTCSSRYPSSSDGSKSIPTAVLYLRDEKRRWKRQLLLKRALQKLDMVECQNSNKHILRNVRLGPRARYFSLTKQEEDIVEDLLSRPDFVDDETSEGNSTTSSISTAFDLEGEDALRMAEIDERLEQFIEIHSQCGSPSLTSVTWSISKQQSVCSQNSNGTISTPSLECNASGKSVCSQNSNGAPSLECNALGKSELETRPRSFASSVEDYLSEKKANRKHQEKVESIDKRLRELIIGEIPTKLPKEQLDMLISQCMMEQNLEVTMRPFLCLKT